MENFNWTSFTKKIAIHSTISKLYTAWTVPEEIEKWFLSKAHFEKPNGSIVKRDEKIKPMDNYEWSWYLFDTTETGKVIEANGVDNLKFTFAGDCIVEIKLSQISENVIVELTQNNIPTDSESKRGIRLGCESGWSFFLVNLKSVYEGGLDLRNKNEELKGMLNN
ncbi:MAG: SRPBCC family protein [Bacteroidota bacterium]